jgi:hypothetical protein
MRSLGFALVLCSSLPAFAAAADGAFVFLPPLVASEPQVVGRVDAAAHPTLWVYSTSKDKGGGYFLDLSKEVSVDGNHFAAKWKVPSLPIATDFRVQVSLDGVGDLGSVDLPAGSVTANQTVPIKFFFNGCIEQKCPGANQCHVASTCDPSTFQCSTTPLLCSPIDACHTTACDETLGVCTHPGLAGEYPTAPQAPAVGSTMPNLSFDGVLYSARTTETTIPMSHYFQDGLAQVVVISQCAIWCAPCAQQAAFLRNLSTQPGYDAGRIAGLELVAQNSQFLPPTLNNLASYSGSTHADAASDPGMTLENMFGVPVADQGFPYVVVVRTRDMSIRWVNLGFDEVGLQAVIDAALADSTPENMCAPQ